MPEWNEEDLAVVKQGAKVINEWRLDHPNDRFDLMGADLGGIDLSGANLSEANLGRAKLTGANLSNADLSDASLRGSILESVNLVGSNLSNASLRRANINRSRLIETNLELADLIGAIINMVAVDRAIFSYTTWKNTCIGMTDLSVCTGLESVRHVGRSMVDYNSLLLSAGELPEVFLRGCGVPGGLIEYLPAIRGSLSPISFYSVFISHSSKNKEFANRLYADLQAEGIRCWLDEHEILPGDRIAAKIDEGIRVWDIVLLCCSEAALDKSWWVDDEIGRAMRKEEKLSKQGKKIDCLIPLNLDSYLFEWEHEWADRLRGRNAADFTNWKDHDAYKVQFDRLVKKLREDSGGRTPPPIPKLGV